MFSPFPLSPLGRTLKPFSPKTNTEQGKAFPLAGAVGCALGGNVDKNDGQTAVEREEIIEGLRDVADDANADQQANHGGDDLNQTCRLMRSRVLGARQIRNRFGAMLHFDFKRLHAKAPLFTHRKWRRTAGRKNTRLDYSYSASSSISTEMLPGVALTPIAVRAGRPRSSPYRSSSN